MQSPITGTRVTTTLPSCVAPRVDASLDGRVHISSDVSCGGAPSHSCAYRWKGTETTGAVHFVGSLNLPNERTVFEMVSSRCGDVVARISDGETGDRQLWIVAQIAVLSRVAGLELVRRERGPHDDWLPDEGLIWLRLRDGVAPGDLEFPPLGYADAASRSYAGFSELQAEGVIPVGVRFQVS